MKVSFPRFALALLAKVAQMPLARLGSTPSGCVMAKIDSLHSLLGSTALRLLAARKFSVGGPFQLVLKSRRLHVG
jgi:hypothetical protein